MLALQSLHKAGPKVHVLHAPPCPSPFLPLSTPSLTLLSLSDCGPRVPSFAPVRPTHTARHCREPHCPFFPPLALAFLLPWTLIRAQPALGHLCPTGLQGPELATTPQSLFPISVRNQKRLEGNSHPQITLPFAAPALICSTSVLSRLPPKGNLCLSTGAGPMPYTRLRPTAWPVSSPLGRSCVTEHAGSSAVLKQPRMSHLLSILPLPARQRPHHFSASC